MRTSEQAWGRYATVPPGGAAWLGADSKPANKAVSINPAKHGAAGTATLSPSSGVPGARPASCRLGSPCFSQAPPCPRIKSLTRGTPLSCSAGMLWAGLARARGWSVSQGLGALKHRCPKARAPPGGRGCSLPSPRAAAQGCRGLPGSQASSPSAAQGLRPVPQSPRSPEQSLVAFLKKVFALSGW